MATIRSIGAGRVLLDFNPALAGRTLIYDVTVTKKLDAEERKNRRNHSPQNPSGRRRQVQNTQ